MKSDDDANVIFARQDYWLKDGAALGLDADKCYLVISAVDSFLEKAEPKLVRMFPGIKRADPELEAKIAADIESERKQAEGGLGMIFG